MLQRLEIEDFGLIARAVLAFSGGLTVCSGETGSGKTMLLGALAFALGERSSPDVVRAGAERARVTLELEPDDALRASLAADGFELDEGEPAILSREMNAAGKSVARLNGRAATAAQLRAVGEAVLDFAGQHEHQRLLSHAYQLHLLDRFAGDDVENARADVARLHARTGALERELAGLRERSGRALAEAEFARFAVNEIDQAALEPGEDDRVRARRDYLANAERIAAALAQARHALISGEGAAVEALGAAGAALSAIGRYSEAIARLAETLGALQSDTNEAAAEISRELDRSELDPRELETLAGRLDAIERLKKKYGGTIDAVLAERATLAAALERLENRDAVELDLAAELASVRSQASERARTLTALRSAAARNLETAVASELANLAMPAARFEIALVPLETLGPAGAERVELLLAPNPGEPPRPLARAASGGELSRVLLALVVVLADRRERTALVFDEIDAGIGGATANAVGVRLGTLARAAQVVCVTHLAQIASWADRHYTLMKRERGGTTTVELIELSERKGILEELARMLSGTSKGVAVDHAETMLRDAHKRKSSRKLSA